MSISRLVRSRRAQVFLAAVALVLIAVPAVDAVPASEVGPIESWDVSGSFYTDAGYFGMSAQSYDGPYQYASFSVMGGDWPNDWFCGSYGEGNDGLMPTIRFSGKDLVTVEGSFASADFGWCYGNPPELITLSLFFTAATVSLEEARGRITFTKSLDPYAPEDLHTLTWRGWDVAITGQFNDLGVNSTNWGGFMVQSELPG